MSAKPTEDSIGKRVGGFTAGGVGMSPAKPDLFARLAMNFVGLIYRNKVIIRIGGKHRRDPSSKPF